MVHFKEPTLRVVFYRTRSGREPVRDWLRGLERKERRVIGEDIKTVQYGWPLGMPLVRSLGDGLWEVRSQLKSRIARVIFFAEGNEMALVHGFSRRARRRRKQNWPSPGAGPPNCEVEVEDGREAPGQ